MIFDKILNTALDEIGDISKWFLYNSASMVALDQNQIFYSGDGYDLYICPTSNYLGWYVNYVLSTTISNPVRFHISVHGVNQLTNEEYMSNFSFLSEWTEEQYFQQSLLDDICLELTTIQNLQIFFQKLILNLRCSEDMKIL